MAAHPCGASSDAVRLRRANATDREGQPKETLDTRMNLSWKRVYLLATRLLAPLCATLAILIFYDLAVHATQIDDARVVGKTRGRRARNTIHAQGRYTYREDVSARLFRTIHVGDTLHVSLSPVFTEWKTMEVVRNGQVVAAARGPELYGMGAMGLFFLLGLAAFLPERVLFAYPLLGITVPVTRPMKITLRDLIVILVITVPVLDFTALLFGFRLVLVWMGQIEKM